MDNWIGVILLIVIDLTIFVITLRSSKAALAQSALIVVLELAYLAAGDPYFCVAKNQLESHWLWQV